jgi:Tfp pilus assembly protein PilF
MAAGNRLKSSDPRAALAHYSVAAEAKPGMVTPVSAMGDCALAMGDTDQAQRHFARALRMRNSYGPALIGMARVHKRLGDNASAAGFYRRYLQVNIHGSQAPEAQAFLEAHGATP